MEYVTHNLCCQIREDDNSSTCTFTIDKSLVFNKAKEGRHVRISNIGIFNLYKLYLDDMYNDDDDVLFALCNMLICIK